ncbi:hypothetical protein CRUP_020580 [Coryphaenoides rupestris]|nr:hypothetical protein CRUP_020580 [Coryphaenoides rupestris]
MSLQERKVLHEKFLLLVLNGEVSDRTTDAGYWLPGSPSGAGGDGGILDLDDVLCDVADDKDRVSRRTADSYWSRAGSETSTRRSGVLLSPGRHARPVTVATEVGHHGGSRLATQRGLWDAGYWLQVHRLEHGGDGGILDLDDVLCDVADDKDRVSRRTADSYWSRAGSETSTRRSGVLLSPGRHARPVTVATEVGHHGGSRLATQRGLWTGHSVSPPGPPCRCQEVPAVRQRTCGRWRRCEGGRRSPRLASPHTGRRKSSGGFSRTADWAVSRRPPLRKTWCSPLGWMAAPGGSDPSLIPERWGTFRSVPRGPLLQIHFSPGTERLGSSIDRISISMRSSGDQLTAKEPLTGVFQANGGGVVPILRPESLTGGFCFVPNQVPPSEVPDMPLHVRRSSDPALLTLNGGPLNGLAELRPPEQQTPPSRRNPSRWSTTAGFMKPRPSAGTSSLERKQQQQQQQQQQRRGVGLSRTLGLLVKRLERGGKADQLALFQEDDCIVCINNTDLRNTRFEHLLLESPPSSAARKQRGISRYEHMALGDGRTAASSSSSYGSSYGSGRFSPDHAPQRIGSARSPPLHDPAGDLLASPPPPHSSLPPHPAAAKPPTGHAPRHSGG